MSLITSAAAAAASPTLSLVTHGHKKVGHSLQDAAASSATQGPATTQSLLSSLFESIEQVLGISITAPQTASATAPAAAAAGVSPTAAGASGTNSPQSAQSTGIHSLSGIGANVNVKA